MASGYYQIEIQEADKKKTAIITRFGLFEHNRMVFGLCNAPATFQRAIEIVLAGLTWKQALAYLDDVNVLGKNFKDHLDNLILVLQRFRKYKLKLKPKKCFLFRTEVTFLGKHCTKDGLLITEDKVEAVCKWPIPKCTKDVESFLGFANYHRDHLRGYANISKSLYALTGKNPFQWTEEHEKAFQAIKSMLTSAPCLAYPRDEGVFILDTDASDHVLSRTVPNSRRQSASHSLCQQYIATGPTQLLHNAQGAIGYNQIYGPVPTLSARQVLCGPDGPQ